MATSTAGVTSALPYMVMMLILMNVFLVVYSVIFMAYEYSVLQHSFVIACLCQTRSGNLAIFMYFWLDSGKILMYYRMAVFMYLYISSKYSCLIRTY